MKDDTVEKRKKLIEVLLHGTDQQRRDEAFKQLNALKSDLKGSKDKVLKDSINLLI